MAVYDLARISQVTSLDAADCILGHWIHQGVMTSLHFALFSITRLAAASVLFRTLNDLFTFESSIWDRKLITSGPHSYTQHSSYAGSMMASESDGFYRVWVLVF
ncbi:hypothetical protein H2248_002404 [Termitomyces sp. 'cryptogamus']|nr:hypothetical protein H2248_002404 [Termitomyces sp. 'cryptogamus']